eukprot:CAMPEP_0202782136 /NCGR_PEP_ID=MMETSP1388-20130828/62069_1 /ASSEMBLY_ACC=CAM_ASM_000864 /TAXON_ID=37098 /ORGANISM="Isochrysis sp, Strain CCMP1244" /LENGTH=309 /DNA_ID=CAMNT_0049451567 /DNA_START=62 /DNA_END=991 /DNA_ORIENTATION=+
MGCDWSPRGSSVLLGLGEDEVAGPRREEVGHGAEGGAEGGGGRLHLPEEDDEREEVVVGGEHLCARAAGHLVVRGHRGEDCEHAGHEQGRAAVRVRLVDVCEADVRERDADGLEGEVGHDEEEDDEAVEHDRPRLHRILERLREVRPTDLVPRAHRRDGVQRDHRRRRARLVDEDVLEEQGAAHLARVREAVRLRRRGDGDGRTQEVERNHLKLERADLRRGRACLDRREAVCDHREWVEEEGRGVDDAEADVRAPAPRGRREEDQGDGQRDHRHHRRRRHEVIDEDVLSHRPDEHRHARQQSALALEQ